MTNMTITLQKADIIREFRQKAWKFAETLDSGDNHKAVYNVKTDLNDSVDSSLIERLMQSRISAATTLFADFFVNKTQTPSTITINLVFPATSVVTVESLTQSLLECVTDGMMSDWAKLTVPSASRQFETSSDTSEIMLANLIYTKRPPTP